MDRIDIILSTSPKYADGTLVDVAPEPEAPLTLEDYAWTVDPAANLAYHTRRRAERGPLVRGCERPCAYRRETMPVPVAGIRDLPFLARVTVDGVACEVVGERSGMGGGMYHVRPVDPTAPGAAALMPDRYGRVCARGAWEVVS